MQLKRASQAVLSGGSTTYGVPSPQLTVAEPEEEEAPAGWMLIFSTYSYVVGSDVYRHRRARWSRRAQGRRARRLGAAGGVLLNVDASRRLRRRNISGLTGMVGGRSLRRVVAVGWCFSCGDRRHGGALRKNALVDGPRGDGEAVVVDEALQVAAGAALTPSRVSPGVA